MGLGRSWRTAAGAKSASEDPLHVKIRRTPAEGAVMADAFKQGQATTPRVDSLVPGEVIGEQTLDGNRVIRYPHRDR